MRKVVPGLRGVLRAPFVAFMRWLVTPFPVKLIQDKIILSLIPPLLLVGAASLFLVNTGNSKFAELIPAWMAFGMAAVMWILGSPDWDNREPLPKATRAVIRLGVLGLLVFLALQAGLVLGDYSQIGTVRLRQLGVVPPEDVVLHVKSLMETRDRRIFSSGKAGEYVTHTAPVFSLESLMSRHEHVVVANQVKIESLGYNPPLVRSKETLEARRLAFMWSVLDHMETAGLSPDPKVKTFVERTIQVFVAEQCGGASACTPDGQSANWNP
jgi:hypothetical protein